MLQLLCLDLWLEYVIIGPYKDKCMHICPGMCLGMRMDMCRDMCMGVRIDICRDTSADMCTGM